MELQKTGQFICILRKQRGLTQRELAEAIGVTDKAVSRWERGRGLPDVSLLSPLAGALGTSVTELLAGEPLSEEERTARGDSVLLEALRYTGSMGRKTAALLIAAAGMFLLLLPLFTAGRALGLRLAGGVLLVLSLLLLRSRRTSRLKARWQALAERLARRSTARVLAAVFLALSLALELTPYGAVLRFGRPAEDGSIGFFRETYSYFSLLPVGYGNFFPFLTGLLTAALLSLSLWRLRRDSRRIGSALFLGTALAAVFSLLPPVLFGAGYFSAAGVGITVCLLLSLGAVILANR
ncbi:MAG: helix-turn-helix transcriptional regulator [Oscillospiraceae bacterium]|jgi:transcriptional regulator with XRE-family HTH domain|nr:helix-turn-helix transcriptional regulator [Oscillospiraceae bacterium]